MSVSPGGAAGAQEGQNPSCFSASPPQRGCPGAAFEPRHGLDGTCRGGDGRRLDTAPSLPRHTRGRPMALSPPGTCPPRVSSAAGQGAGGTRPSTSPLGLPGTPAAAWGQQGSHRSRGRRLSPWRGGEAQGGCGRVSLLPLAGSRSGKGAVILFINSNLPLEH